MTKSRAWVDVPVARRKMMESIRGKDTKPEMVVRRLLHGQGYRYRLHRRDLPGRPDLAFPSRRKVIEVRGCFWHSHAGCKHCTTPRTRQEYWLPKLARNRERDAANEAALRSIGWQLLVVWECELADPALVLDTAVRFLDEPGANLPKMSG